MPTTKKKTTAPASKYTLGRRTNEPLFDVELPSGATCQARRPGVQGLIAVGLLDSFDELTSLIKTEHLDKKAVNAKPTPENVAATVEGMTSAKLHTALMLVDKLTVYIVTDPSVWIDYRMAEETEEEFAERQAKAERDGSIAVRDIDMDDKMFLMDWSIGGSGDLAAFRQGS